MCYLLACVQCLTLMCGHSKYISSKIYLEIELMYKSLLVIVWLKLSLIKEVTRQTSNQVLKIIVTSKNRSVKLEHGVHVFAMTKAKDLCVYVTHKHKYLIS